MTAAYIYNNVSDVETCTQPRVLLDIDDKRSGDVEVIDLWALEKLLKCVFIV